MWMLFYVYEIRNIMYFHSLKTCYRIQNQSPLFHFIFAYEFITTKEIYPPTVNLLGGMYFYRYFFSTTTRIVPQKYTTRVHHFGHHDECFGDVTKNLKKKAVSKRSCY